VPPSLPLACQVGKNIKLATISKTFIMYTQHINPKVMNWEFNFTNGKHLEKRCSVFGGHLISINFPPRKWEEYYAYSSIVRRFLHIYKKA
jgi:hypothetical protein